MKHGSPRRWAFASLALAALIVSATPALAQAAPDAPAAVQARRLVEAFVSGDEAGFLRFVHAAYPGANRADAEWLQQRGALHAIQLHAITTDAPTHSDAIVFVPGRGDWLKLSLTVEAQAPYAITGFEVHLTRRPADVSGPPKLPPAEMARAVQTLAQAETDADRFSGAVLIAKDGKPFYSQAFGMADIAARKPNTLKTRFRFGSMGKMFTEVAIMQLAQAGKLDLKAPIGRYLPDYPNPEVARTVTIDELMTHSSGLGDVFNARFDAHQGELRDPKDYVALFGPDPPLFPPGTRQAYSNYGFMVLGRIIEAASGQTWDDYLQAHIFGPAGMTGSGDRPDSSPVPNRAIGYWAVNGGPQVVTPKATARLRGTPARPPGGDGYITYRGTPGGGGYSTVGDMLRFADALIGNRLLDAEHTRLLTAGTTILPSGKSTGYDFSTPTQEGRRYLGHEGAAAGQSGSLRIFAPEHYIIVVLANRDSPAAQTIATFVSERAP